MSASELANRLRRIPQRGEVVWIGLRPAHEAPMKVVEEVVALTDRGLMGDRASKPSRGGKRQVTLIQEEHLAVIGSLVRRGVIDAALLRRNVVVRGINLVSLKSLRFRIGDDVVLLGTGPCEPCGKMDAALGEGGFHAMRGHGGITTRVVRGGILRIGDAVWVDEASVDETSEGR